MRHVKDFLKAFFGEQPTQWLVAFITIFGGVCLALIHYFGERLSARIEFCGCVVGAACLFGGFVASLRMHFPGPVATVAFPFVFVATILFLGFMRVVEWLGDRLSRLLNRRK